MAKKTLEQTWLEFTNFSKMFQFLNFGHHRALQIERRTKLRKQRIHACGCCRLWYWEHMKEITRIVLEGAERYANGQVELKQILRYREKIDGARYSQIDPVLTADGAALWASQPEGTFGQPEFYLGRNQKNLCSLLREVFGNPFRPVNFDPIWRTPTVISLALATWEERELPSGQLESARLAILADALEDAGCAGEELLAHLHSSGPHVRGCWALDLVLGKS